MNPINRSKYYLKYGYLLLVVPVFFLIRYYYINDPETSHTGTIFAVCPFHYATTFHCPGCGSQRAIHDLLNFRVWEAFKHNIFILIVLLILLAKGYAFLSKKYLPAYYYDLGGKAWFTWGLVVFVFGYWIVRNLPYPPFTLLAP